MRRSHTSADPRNTKPGRPSTRSPKKPDSEPSTNQTSAFGGRHSWHHKRLIRRRLRAQVRSPLFRKMHQPDFDPAPVAVRICRCGCVSQCGGPRLPGARNHRRPRELTSLGATFDRLRFAGGTVRWSFPASVCADSRFPIGDATHRAGRLLKDVTGLMDVALLVLLRSNATR
jgi:hypothetical protein